ncbi:MAG: hypothetical protein ACK559_40900, partial [bacterium]
MFRYLEKAELGTIFALPWLITWFGHVLPDYGDVVRLYDYFLAQPPLMPIYLAAAIVLHRREDILASGESVGRGEPQSTELTTKEGPPQLG